MSFFCPSSPTSGIIRCLLYRLISSFDNSIVISFTDNEIRGGTIDNPHNCMPPPNQMPAAVGYLDGLPPNFQMGKPGELPSAGTTVDANGEFTDNIISQ